MEFTGNMGLPGLDVGCLSGIHLNRTLESNWNSQVKGATMSESVADQSELTYEPPVISRLNYVGVVWPLKEEDAGFPEKYFFARQHSGSPCAVTAKGFGLVAAKSAQEEC